jgi:8-oxo-dGTP pyrophosphatase MutT (NUDIX family)
MSAPKPWQVLTETTLLDRRWLRLREQRVKLSNGHEIEQFHVIDGPDWAAVLAITPEHDVVLVRQYRHGAGALSLELPAGVIEPYESPMQAVERELLEETGYVADSFEPLVALRPEPARHTNRAHFFVALGARLARAAAPEPSEELEVELHPARALPRLIEQGDISHGVHLGVILLAARRGLLRLD